MKKYFYIIVIDVLYFITKERRPCTDKLSCTGIIEVEAKEDKPSLIFKKIFQKSMIEWKIPIPGQEIIGEPSPRVEFFNFWEEKEIPVDFMDIPIEEWDISIGLISDLKNLRIRTYKDIHAFADDVIPLHLGKKNLMELKEFLKTNGVKFPKW